jgi:hypothetical protein
VAGKVTVSALAPARILNSSAARCCVLPTLIVTMFTAPGSRRMCANRSPTERRGEFGGTISAMAKAPSVTTGAKSHSGS